MRFTKQLIDRVSVADLLPAGEGGLVLLFVVYKALPDLRVPVARDDRVGVRFRFRLCGAASQKEEGAEQREKQQACARTFHTGSSFLMVLSGNSIAHNRRFVQTAENIGKTEQNRWLTRHRKAGAFLDRAGRNRYGICKQNAA